MKNKHYLLPLTPEQHKALKIYAINKETSIKELLCKYIDQLIKKAPGNN